MKFLYRPIRWFILGAAGFAGTASATECISALPSELQEHISEVMPGFSSPSSIRLDPASVKADLNDHGSGCYVVAKGHFDNRRDESYAFLVATPDGRPQLLVGLIRRHKWTVEKLPTFCDDITYCYVKTAGPGSYTRSAALDAPPTGKTEREKIIATHDVIISGRLESTGVTYAKGPGGWAYVWTSD